MWTKGGPPPRAKKTLSGLILMEKNIIKDDGVCMYLEHADSFFYTDILGSFNIK